MLLCGTSMGNICLFNGQQEDMNQIKALNTGQDDEHATCFETIEPGVAICAASSMGELFRVNLNSKRQIASIELAVSLAMPITNMQRSGDLNMIVCHPRAISILRDWSIVKTIECNLQTPEECICNFETIIPGSEYLVATNQ